MPITDIQTSQPVKPPDMTEQFEPITIFSESNSIKTVSPLSMALVVWLCLITAVCTLLITFFGLKFIKNHNSELFGSQGNGTSEYVFVDEEKLYALKLKDAIKRPGMSMEKAQEDASAFKVSVEKELSVLAKNGKIVLTKQAVLAGGASLDVTDQVATSLGFKP